MRSTLCNFHQVCGASGYVTSVTCFNLKCIRQKANVCDIFLVPTAPRQLQIVDEFSDTISVKWLRPREVNGVLVGYVVKYWIVNNYDQRIGQIKTEQIKGDALQTGVTNLASRTSYMIEIAAKTKAGVSRSSRIKGRTQDVART